MMTPSLRDACSLVDVSALALQWEEVSCLLCGSPSWKPVLEGPDLSPGAEGLRFLVVQCQVCGLCYTNPRPSPRSIEQFYQADYAPHWKSADHPPASGRLLRSRARSLRKSLPLQGEGRLLDFGCGSGSYLLRMQRQGWKVTGLDFSAAAIDRLRTHHGVHALVGSLPHPALDDVRFDVVTMWHALEHVHQPLEALCAANHLLADGGQIIVAVPNMASMALRWFEASWIGLDLPRHLTHFTPSTLQLMLAKAGFGDIRISQQRRSGWFRATARLGQTQGAGPVWLARLAKSRLGSSTLSWVAHLLRRSDCLVAVARK